MTLTILGIVVLFLPLALMRVYENKKLGFIYLISYLIAFHLLVGIITQAIGIFYYWVVLTLTLLFDICIIYWLMRKGLLKAVKKINFDWTLLAVLLIGFIYLFNVHYNYSGKYTTALIPEYQSIEHLSYAYPYFSDEWYSIAFIEDAIDNSSFPIKNPLIHNRPDIINLELAFHSFLAEITLLLNLNPQIHYINLSIAFNLLIIVLIYILLMANNVARLPASIASLMALFITNGANLPGLWYLLPISLGLIALLLGFILLSYNKTRGMLALLLLTLLFYPPLIIFYTVAVFFAILFSKKFSPRQRIETLLDYFILIILAGFIFQHIFFINIGFFVSILLYALIAVSIIITHGEKHLEKIKQVAYILFCLFVAYQIFNHFYYYDVIGEYYSNLWQYLNYTTFTANAIPMYTIYHIIPIPVLVLSIFAIQVLIKNYKWLLYSIAAGLLYWIFYSFSLDRYIIEYQRVILVTAILITIAAGFGLQYLMDILKKIHYTKNNNILKYVHLILLLGFIFFIPYYTLRDNWQKLKLVNIKTDKISLPAAPANQYLHPDDLKLFQNIHNKNFLSLPWKGTVIGVTTDNYPLTVKPGTITLNTGLSSQFQKGGCDEKYIIAREYAIEYVYFPSFKCPQFKYMDTSKEGLSIYKVSIK